MLHHDGRWSHEGVPVLNRRLREAFDRSVRFVPAQRGGAAEPDREVEQSAIEQGREAAAQRGETERSAFGPAGVFVVQLGRFRGQIDVEEAAFFVRDFDAATGTLRLSDGSAEPLDVATLGLSPRDGAGLCRVKRALAPEGLLARFTHAAWSELLGAIEGPAQGPRLRLAERSVPLPDEVVRVLG